MSQEQAILPAEPADLQSLVGHRESVQATDALEDVHKRFAKHEYEYMAVLEGAKLTGLCARRQVGMVLGARFGFAMYSRRPVSESLLPEATMVRVGQTLPQVLQEVFTRPEAILFDDVLLVDEAGAFLGLIFARTLVRMQNSLFLEKIDLLQKQQRMINEKNEEMVRDLRMAGEIQQTLLPQQRQQFPAQASGKDGGLRFYHRYQPSGLISGDFFHVFPLSQQSVGIFICDVMGHGVRSAFVTAMLRTLVQELGHLGADPAELLTRINRELKAILQQTGDLMFATALYLIVDAATGRVRFANAGHPQALVLRRDSGKVETLKCQAGTNGPALGLFAESRYGATEAEINAGDAIFFYTDGLVELFNAKGEEFGEEKLRQAIEGRQKQELEPLMEGVFAEAAKFAGEAGFADDVCFVGMQGGGA